MKQLGGLRHPKRDSINTGWENESFRGYADYMQTPEFAEALSHLVELAERKSTAIMCAEILPWRCHRSMIADALTVRGIEVIEIIDQTESRPHRLTSFANVEGDRITYPPATERTAPSGIQQTRMISTSAAPIVMFALIALEILAGIATIGVIAYVIYFYVVKGLLAPARETRAKVLRKSQREWEVDAPKYIGGPGVGSMLFSRGMAALGKDTTFTVYESWDYLVRFSIDGQEREFAVPEATYIDIQEGDEGVLSYRGELFKYFLPLRPAASAAAVAP
jgi:hypothetical protein